MRPSIPQLNERLAGFAAPLAVAALTLSLLSWSPAPLAQADTTQPAGTTIVQQSVTVTKASTSFKLHRAKRVSTKVVGNVGSRAIALRTNKAWAQTTLSGQGTLYVVARGTTCKGNAKVRVYVDGRSVKTITTSSVVQFQQYPIMQFSGTHTVKVRLVNDKTLRKRCSRDIFVTAVHLATNVTVEVPGTTPDPEPTTPSDTPSATPTPVADPVEVKPTPTTSQQPEPDPVVTPTPTPSLTPTPTPTPTPTAKSIAEISAWRASLVPGSYFPDASNTGLIDASVLETVDGNVTLSDQSSQVKVIENKRFRGYVYLTGKNYLFRNCLFEGPANPQYAAVVARYATSSGNVFEDSTFKPRGINYYNGTINGRGFTLKRVELTGAVDGANPSVADGGTRLDVTITGSWVHDLLRWSPDPTHSDNQSHSDGIQWMGGRGLTLIGNRIEGLLDTSISSWGPATYDSSGKMTGGHPFYPNPVNGETLMVNAYQDKIQPGELTMRKNWIRGGAVGLNMLGATSAWASNDGSSIEENWFLNDQGYGKNHRMVAKASQVISTSTNYVWDLANPMSKATQVSIRVNV